MHTVRNNGVCFAVIGLLLLSGWTDIMPSSLAAAEPERALRVLIVDGYSNHDWQRTTRLIRGILEPTGLFEIQVATAPAREEDPAYATWRPAFKDYDVVIQTCNDIGRSGPLWPAPALEAFEQYVRDGGGVFILHSANNAFVNWEEYNKIIGIGWRKKEYGWALRIKPDETIERIAPGAGAGTGHGPRTDRVIHRLGDHPIHAGLPRTWKTPLIEVYTHARGPAENLTVLSWAEDPTTRERWPMEWVVEYGQGRAYSSTFGHVWRDEKDPVNMRCAGFQTIMVRTLQWLVKRPVTFGVPQDFPDEEKMVLRPASSPAAP